MSVEVTISFSRGGGGGGRVKVEERCAANRHLALLPKHVRTKRERLAVAVFCALNLAVPTAYATTYTINAGDNIVADAPTLVSGDVWNLLGNATLGTAGTVPAQTYGSYLISSDTTLTINGAPGGSEISMPLPSTNLIIPDHQPPVAGFETVA